MANGRLLREGEFDNLWIQPAAGDAGGALGAALFVWYQLLDKPRPCEGRDAQQGSFLGPGLQPIRSLDSCPSKASSGQRFDDEADLIDHTAGLLADGKVIGWFQGRMEFGPRALGAAAFSATPALRPCKPP